MKTFCFRLEICNKRQQGMTLIEVMIALLLGAFLIGGVIRVFIAARQTYAVQDALSRVQENGRFAMDFIANDIRMADYRDCPKDRDKVMTAVLTDGGLAMKPALGDPGSVENNAGLNGSDQLSVNWETSGSTSRCPPNPPTTTSAYSPPCSTPNSPAGTPATPRTSCLTPPTNSPRVYRIASSSGQPNLIQGNPLIEGVENMQVLYGEDTDLDLVSGKSIDYAPNYYVPAGTAGLNMSRVVSVRVSLLIRSVEDNLTSDFIPYYYNGVTVKPIDHRIRRVFTSTFALRNRIR